MLNWSKFTSQFMVQIIFSICYNPQPLWPSQINTNLSAHAQIFGNFNYDYTPMAPPSIKFILQ